MSLFFTIFTKDSAFLDKESSSQKYHNKEYKQIRSETWTKGTLQQCFADCDKTNVGHRIGIDDAITPQQQKKRESLVIYRTITIDKCIGYQGLPICTSSIKQPTMFWFHGQFSLCVLQSPEKYVTISVRTHNNLMARQLVTGHSFSDDQKIAKGNSTHAKTKSTNNSCTIGFQGLVFIANLL